MGWLPNNKLLSHHAYGDATKRHDFDERSPRIVRDVCDHVGGIPGGIPVHTQHRVVMLGIVDPFLSTFDQKRSSRDFSGLLADDRTRTPKGDAASTASGEVLAMLDVAGTAALFGVRKSFNMASVAIVRAPTRESKKNLLAVENWPPHHGDVHHGRRDSCHAPIRKALRDCGLPVQDTADLGRDFPDLVTARAGVTYMLECKDPKTGKELPGQSQARTAWLAKGGGPWLVVHTVQEALRAVGLVR